MDRTELYRDIRERTGGDIYLGVVGPVRTGKSTFIKRFMDVMVLPGMHDEHARERIIDELPQSASGRTIMTTQPKFVPNQAAELLIGDNADIRVRMIDCVGYMIPGAVGHVENDAPRMVRTPWFDYDIPFEDAAEIGTRKVITEHSTIGVVITTDGTITDIDRSDYVEAEGRVVYELKEQGKPFIVILNTREPESPDTAALARTLSERYETAVYPVDALSMSVQQINALLEQVLLEFPINMIHVELPSWMSALGREHWLVRRVIEPLSELSATMNKMKDAMRLSGELADIEGFEPAILRRLALGSGNVEIDLRPVGSMFYTVLGEECGYEIRDDAHLISTIKEFVTAKREYDRISPALLSAYGCGYGMVPPVMDEMILDEPEIVQHGSRFGVKLKAHSSGIHMIRVDIETELSPLVGTQEQSAEFMSYLTETFEQEPTKIWQTNIFGKPLYDLVRESMATKVNRLPETVQQRLQETLERMVNEGCNGLICILL